MPEVPAGVAAGGGGSGLRHLRNRAGRAVFELGVGCGSPGFDFVAEQFADPLEGRDQGFGEVDRVFDNIEHPRVVLAPHGIVENAALAQAEIAAGAAGDGNADFISRPAVLGRDDRIEHAQSRGLGHIQVFAAIDHAAGAGLRVSRRLANPQSGDNVQNGTAAKQLRSANGFRSGQQNYSDNR